ncbi:MAG TPA: hypothetical protein VHZ51_22140 [Ktedonobacteraceae bacterium]|nr:hypothetical protein [Ktedonobacteraceae bacterium]
MPQTHPVQQVDDQGNDPQLPRHSTRRPPRWTAALGAIVLGLLYAALPEEMTYGPNWLPLALIIILLLPFPISHLLKKPLPHVPARILTFALLAVVTLALATAVMLLVYTLPHRSAGAPLLGDALLLWLVNVLVFSLWYWEVDGGGPLKRHLAGHPAADFMFPQQQIAQQGGDQGGWAPHFVDYLFVAFTGATAFSPTDTFPLTRKAKGLMMVEAILAFTIIVLVAARAVNIL